MTRAVVGPRIALGLVGALAMATVVVPSGREMRAGEIARHARQVASQGIRDDVLDRLDPPSVSHDGRLVAFVARRPHSGPQRCCQNIYVLDRTTGQMTQESIPPDGTPSNGDSQAPSLSSNGRIIAFETVAGNLGTGDTGFSRNHIVVRDRETGAVRTLAGDLGQPPHGETSQPVVSADGAVVAFTSQRSDLVPQRDANEGGTDIYLWRLDETRVIRVSVDSDGRQPSHGASHSASVSGDGDLVAFVSTARLEAHDTDDRADVYLRDVRRGHTLRVSRTPGVGAYAGGSYSPALSADGRFVAFVSESAYAPGDRNGQSDVYVYDVTHGSIGIASATSTGAAANAATGRPAISADGRHVVIQSLASNLGSPKGCTRTRPDTNLLPDVYLVDRMTDCITRVSGSPVDEWWTPSVAPAINGGGTLIVFSSTQWAGPGDVVTDFDLFLVPGE
jgi:Tol biopolymer transport system component